MKVIKPYWWCIGDECYHIRRIVGKKDHYNNNRCAHPDIIKQLPSNIISIVGYPVKRMEMCPVFTTVEIAWEEPDTLNIK